MFYHSLSRTISTMLIFALLFLTIPTASASNAGDYPVSTFVKEVSLTVRLPEEAWIITQETPITDDFFQVVGTNAYAGIMNDLKTIVNAKINFT